MRKVKPRLIAIDDWQASFQASYFEAFAGLSDGII